MERGQVSYGTNHIREMLSQAIDAIEKADRLYAPEDVDLDAHPEDKTIGDVRRRRMPEIQRLLQGAVFNAQHAAAEIQDERFRLQYGEDGYTRV
jgi:hypothetical protein